MPRPLTRGAANGDGGSEVQRAYQDRLVELPSHLPAEVVDKDFGCAGFDSVQDLTDDAAGTDLRDGEIASFADSRRRRQSPRWSPALLQTRRRRCVVHRDTDVGCVHHFIFEGKCASSAMPINGAGLEAATRRRIIDTSIPRPTTDTPMWRAVREPRRALSIVLQAGRVRCVRSLSARRRVVARGFGRGGCRGRVHCRTRLRHQPARARRARHPR